jgi:hypothetical protein
MQLRHRGTVFWPRGKLVAAGDSRHLDAAADASALEPADQCLGLIQRDVKDVCDLGYRQRFGGHEEDRFERRHLLVPRAEGVRRSVGFAHACWGPGRHVLALALIAAAFCG